MNLEETIAWNQIETILMRDYPVGHKKEGNKAYSPLFLFKRLLLQKWLRIKSDPELEKFDLIVSDILNQFSKKGLILNEGIAVDARVVKSASHPMSNKKLEELKAKRETLEGKLYKNGNPLKFARDIESN